ncbi:hypothetical protein V1517DRAFT_170841 [Lipomyces orientalis]|uniref:Uncharacterized protein n=1 Tax=Lipomyces orientalis TaxID=1233043 RepID=A0ACC3TK09_9ASCO
MQRRPQKCRTEMSAALRNGVLRLQSLAGYMTSRYHHDQDGFKHRDGSRCDPLTTQGKAYRTRYWNDTMFDALDMIRSVARKYELTGAECKLRCMVHHSKLKRERGDAVIIGASTHLEENLVDLEKGPYLMKFWRHWIRRG